MSLQRNIAAEYDFFNGLLGVPAIKVPRGLPSFKGHLLVTSRFAFAPRLTAPSMALRAMPGAPEEGLEQEFN